jgi:hypothetical protein
MIESFSNKVNGQQDWVLPLETSLAVQSALDEIHAF